MKPVERWAFFCPILTDEAAKAPHYHVCILMKFPMNQRPFLICIFLLGSLFSAISQIEEDQKMLQGILLDQQTRSPLAYANIYNHTTDRGTISDES